MTLLLGLMIAGFSPAQAKAPKPTSKPALVIKRAKQLRQLVRATARLRKLWPRRRISMGVMSRAQILAEIEKRLAEDYTDDEIATDAAVLERLGLLPANTAYKAELLKLLTDQVAGFYDPRSRKLNVADWLPLSLQTPALVHEICHALQDQYLRLARFIKPLKSDSDRQLARIALVEGDCTGVMIEYLLAKEGRDLGSLSSSIDQVTKLVSGQQSAVFKAAPIFLRESLIFPYAYGLRFVQKVRRRKSWAQLNRLYRRLPQSTEQIMHFDKYLRREAPVKIRVRPLPALSGHTRVKVNTIGEFQLYLLARKTVGEAIGRRAAAGWGGDRLAAYLPAPPANQPKKKSRRLPLVIHLTSWDSEADAVEFVNVWRRLMAASTRQNQPAESGPRLWVRRDRQGLQWSLQHHGKHVLALVGIEPALRARLQSEVWARWRINNRRVHPR